MQIKILNKFGYQTFPVVDGMIEVEEDILKEIGKTLCFDVENNTVIPYDNSSQIKVDEIQLRISELKSLLSETDYRALKYFEGYYTEEEYAPYKAQRQAYRDEINQLEKELETLN